MRKKKMRQPALPVEEPELDPIRQAELMAAMQEELSALQALYPETESVEELLEYIAAFKALLKQM